MLLRNPGVGYILGMARDRGVPAAPCHDTWSRIPRSMQNLAVIWLSLAACLVVIGVAGVRLSR